MAQPPRPAPSRLDRAGIWLSGMCAVHCVAGLVLVTGLGLGGFLLDPAIHRIGLVLAIAIGALTVGLGTRRHGRALPLGVALVGLGLMAGGVFARHGLEEVLLTVPGVALVALAHLLNLRASSCTLSRGA